MYKWAVRTMIRRNIERLNQGDYGPALSMFAADATLSFPGDNSWARQHRGINRGRSAFATHRGRDEIESFLQRYVATGMQMAVEDILVNGPPWRARAAARVHDWSPDPATGVDRYCNRAVLFVETRWGRIVAQEDYEDTERAAAFDRVLDATAS